MSELKPCPFCGKRPHIEDGRNDRPWVVQCYNRDCNAQPYMDHADTRAQAVADWNTRTPDPRITRLEADRVELIEALEGAVKWVLVSDDPRSTKDLHVAEAVLRRIKEK